MRVAVNSFVRAGAKCKDCQALLRFDISLETTTILQRMRTPSNMYTVSHVPPKYPEDEGSLDVGNSQKFSNPSLEPASSRMLQVWLMVDDLGTIEERLSTTLRRSSDAPPPPPPPLHY